MAPSCASFLRELQILWDEIGEDEVERDKVRGQLDQECVNLYKKEVENTQKRLSYFNQFLVKTKEEIKSIASSLGESVSFSLGNGSLKEQIAVVKPILEELKFQKKKRVNEMATMELQIGCILGEIAGSDQSYPKVEVDLTPNRLEELKSHLEELENEKDLRLQKVSSHLSTIRELSIVMSVEVHPSLGNSSIGYSNDTLARLTDLINSLKQERQQRLQKLQGLGRMLIELWNLMDTPTHERKRFDHVTSLVSFSVDEVSREGCLASEVLEQAEAEVHRLQTTALLIDSGNVDMFEVGKAKELALSQKDILDKVKEWKLALDEEKWLHDYERDENRYSAGKGAQKNLNRVVKARTIVSKIPSMVENLTSKVKAWELDKGICYFYDKVPLLNSLQEYAVQRQEKVKCQDAYDRIIERVRDGKRYYALNFPGITPKVICLKVYEATKLVHCFYVWESQTCCLAGYPHLLIELKKLFNELAGGCLKLTTEGCDVVSPWPLYKAEYWSKGDAIDPMMFPWETFLMKLDVIKMVKEDDESDLEKKIPIVFRCPMSNDPSYLKISNRVDKYSLFFRAFILKLSALTAEHPPDSFSSEPLLRGEEGNYKLRFLSDHEDLNPPVRFWKVREEGGIEDDICDGASASASASASAIEVDGGLSFSEFLDKLIMIEVEGVFV